MILLHWSAQVLRELLHQVPVYSHLSVLSFGELVLLLPVQFCRFFHRGCRLSKWKSQNRTRSLDKVPVIELILFQDRTLYAWLLSLSFVTQPKAISHKWSVTPHLLHVLHNSKLFLECRNDNNLLKHSHEKKFHSKQQQSGVWIMGKHNSCKWSCPVLVFLPNREIREFHPTCFFRDWVYMYFRRLYLSSPGKELPSECNAIVQGNVTGEGCIQREREFFLRHCTSQWECSWACHNCSTYRWSRV